MRKSIFQVNRRQQALLMQLEQEHVVYVNRLSEQYGVSEITIRRDLESMEKAKLVTRFHGGAKLPNEPAEAIPPFEEKGLRNLDEKVLIARQVAELIREDDTVFMNSGSTVAHIPPLLEDKRVTIITNNAKMAGVDYGENVSLLITGGMHNKISQSLTGDLTKYALEQVYATVCVLGVNGISAEVGVTTSLYQETEINETMLNRCRGKRIVAADSSKVGRTLNFISAPIGKIDLLVTTSRADTEEIEKLRAEGVEVIVVPYQQVDLDMSNIHEKGSVFYGKKQ